MTLHAAAPPLEYEAQQWMIDGRRNLLIIVALPVMPYVRQTRTTRWRQDHPAGARARAYNESRATLRDALAGIMLAKHLKPLPAAPLGMASSFWLKNPSTSDLGNCEKALEDAANKILYPDDRWIWHRGNGFKAKGTPRFRLHLWELGGGHRDDLPARAGRPGPGCSGGLDGGLPEA